MNRLFIAALLVGVAFSPAYAKDKNDHAIEKAEDRVERLQDRLADDDLNDKQRDKIEDRIESIADKFDLTLPPPPPPDRPICNQDPLVYCDEQ
jgi:3-hydroxyacyl-CoA dehydrogenase